MKTRDLIKIIQEDYDILCKSGLKYRCCVQTLDELVQHLGGEIIDGKVMIPIPSEEFRVK